MPTTTYSALGGKKIVAYGRRTRPVEGDNWKSTQREIAAEYSAVTFGRAPDDFIFDETCQRVFDRPGLSAALLLAFNGQLGVLLVPDKRTIATISEALIECWNRFDRFGVKVHSIEDGRDLDLLDTVIGSRAAASISAGASSRRRIVGYAKCSLSGSSISAQNYLLNAFAYCNHGRRLDDFYCDAGGRLTWERPGFRALMQDVEAGRIGTIIVSDFDRLGRTKLFEAEFKKLCEAHDVQIQSVSDMPVPGIVAKPRRPLPNWRSASDRMLHHNRFAWQRIASVRQREARKR